jgi:hypothetical protein
VTARDGETHQRGARVPRARKNRAANFFARFFQNFFSREISSVRVDWRMSRASRADLRRGGACFSTS